MLVSFRVYFFYLTEKQEVLFIPGEIFLIFGLKGFWRLLRLVI